MSALIDFISGDVDRIVIDRTGFTARVQSPSRFCSSVASRVSTSRVLRSHDLYRPRGTAWPAAVSAAGPVDVLVIDRVERPL